MQAEAALCRAGDPIGVEEGDLIFAEWLSISPKHGLGCGFDDRDVGSGASRMSLH
jgi:hypothetical protein